MEKLDLSNFTPFDFDLGVEFPMDDPLVFDDGIDSDNYSGNARGTILRLASELVGDYLVKERDGECHEEFIKRIDRRILRIVGCVLEAWRIAGCPGRED